MFERFKKSVRKGTEDTRRILSAEFQNQANRTAFEYLQSGGNMDSSVRSGQVQIQAPQYQNDTDIVFIRNDLYHDLRKFDVVTLGPVENNPNEDYAAESALYTDPPVFRVLPQVPDRQGRTAVILQDVKRCSYGMAVVSGVAWARGAVHRGTHVGSGPGEIASGVSGESAVSIAAQMHYSPVPSYSGVYTNQVAESFVIDSIDNGYPDPDTGCAGRCLYTCKNSQWTVSSESCSGDCRCQVGPGTSVNTTCTDGETLEGNYCASWPKRLSHIRIGQLQFLKDQVYSDGALGVDRNSYILGLCEYECQSGNWVETHDPEITAPRPQGGEFTGFECLPAASIPVSMFPCDSSTDNCNSRLVLPPVIKESGSQSDYDNNGYLYYTTTTGVPGTTPAPTTLDPSCQTRSCLYSSDTVEPSLVWDHCRSWAGPDYRCYCDMGAPDANGNWQYAGERVIGGPALLQTMWKSQCVSASCTGGCWWKPTVDGWVRVGANPCSPWCECPKPDEPAPLYADSYCASGTCRVEGGVRLFYTSCGQESCTACESGLCKWVSDPNDGSWTLESNTCSTGCSCNPNPPSLNYIFQVNRAAGSRDVGAIYYRKCCSNSISVAAAVHASTTTTSAPFASTVCMGACNYICTPFGWSITHHGCFPSSPCSCPENAGTCTASEYGSVSSVNCGYTSTTTTTTTSTTTTTTSTTTTTTTTTTTSTTTSTTTPPPTTTTTTTTTSSTTPAPPTTTSTSTSSSTTPLPP